MKQKGFFPTEIIFSATNACNLHCEHCFIERNPHKLNISDALIFLKNCVTTGGTKTASGLSLPKIDRIGFSGGEPFLYMDFLLELTKAAVSHDLMFDQIMTNGDWWKNKTELRSTLQSLYDAGYDGKIGLSWDSYHGQDTKRMETFIQTVQEIFGKDSINIQTVDPQGALRGAEPPVEGVESNEVRTRGRLPPSALSKIPVYHLPRTYTSDNPHAWQAKHWFSEDYCEGPGHIFYVHADGNIAPCCGFANENPDLFIGRITDSLETIMQNASKNQLIKICYEEGLSHFRRHGLKKYLRLLHKKLPGKTADICTFCDYVCKTLKN